MFTMKSFSDGYPSSESSELSPPSFFYAGAISYSAPPGAGAGAGTGIPPSGSAAYSSIAGAHGSTYSSIFFCLGSI